MKKYLYAITAILIYFCVNVYAASPPIPETASAILLRNAITSDDTDVITVAASDTARIAGYANVALEFNIEGTNPSWNVMLYYSGDTAWVLSGSRTITSDEVYVARTFGYELMTMTMDTSSGTNPSMTVTIIPFND